MSQPRPEHGVLRVAIVGSGFMGAAHSHAWRTAPHAFELSLRVRQRVLCGRDPERAAASAERLGWEESTTDWEGLVEREDIDLVDVCVPGEMHSEVAVAALRNGKHVLCEKPLANTVAEAREMEAAANAAAALGVRSMVGFNYRRVPALALAREWVAAGRLGSPRQIRISYLQDWLADAEAPTSWRLERSRAGSGALGDLGSHAVDLAQFLLDEPLVAVSATTATFVDERPDGAGGRGRVTVDDCALFTGRFAGGALASFEATRFATGRKNSLRLELSGSEGAIVFDLEQPSVIGLYLDGDGDRESGFRQILVTEPVHPYLEAWWPPGHVLGWDQAFVHQVADLVKAIGSGESPRPSFADGLRVQEVLAAVERSAAGGSRWTAVEEEKEEVA